MATLNWEVRPRAGGGWEGCVTLSMAQAGSPHAVQVVAPGHSPGHALESAVHGAADMVGALDEVGFFPLAALLPQLLPVLTEVAQRVRRGVEAAVQTRGTYDPEVLGAEVVSDVLGDEQLGEDLGFDFGDALRTFGNVTQTLAPLAATFAQRGQAPAYGPPQGYAPPAYGPPQGYAPAYGPPQGYAAPQKPAWRPW